MPRDRYAGSGTRRCADAEAAYTRELAILDPGPGRETPVVTESLNNLAELHRVQGRYALGACRRNAPTSILGGTKRIGRIEIVDPEPDARLHSSSQCRQTHYSDRLLAEPLYRRTLVILEKSVGPQHQRVGITLNNLAEVYGAQGRWRTRAGSTRRRSPSSKRIWARITRRWRVCWRTTPRCFAAHAGTPRRSRSTDAPATFARATPYRTRAASRSATRAQMRGGARWPHARRSLSTLSVRSRAPTNQMGPYRRPAGWGRG